MVPLRTPSHFAGGGGGGGSGMAQSWRPGDGWSGQASHLHGQDEIDHYSSKWGLDEGAKALLRGLSPEARATVIAEFQPRSNTFDASGKLCSSARSVAARLQNRGPIIGDQAYKR